MLNSQLDTFIKVAKARSFNKASELLFVTPPAVIKQINSLESELDVKLFERTRQGLILTPAGRSFYRDAVYMTGYIRDAVERARTSSGQKVIRVGMSPLNPVSPVLEFLSQISQKMPSVQFTMVPFENTPENAREILQYLGERIDIIPAIFDKEILSVRHCAGTELMKLPLQLAVSIQNPLSLQKKITLDKLSGENLFLIHRGWSCSYDAVRTFLKQKYPQINIVDFDFFDINIFNRCAHNEGLLVSLGYWKAMHPLIRIVPAEWNFSIPYGFLHSTNPSPLVKDFLHFALQVV